MKIKKVLKKLKKAPTDTELSRALFLLEEGKVDAALQASGVSGRRDWLILADIYNEGEYTQKFHLQNYLQFKLHDGLDEQADFEQECFRYIRNVALILYIREVIFKESPTVLEPLYAVAKEYYENEGRLNNISLAAQMRK